MNDNILKNKTIDGLLFKTIERILLQGSSLIISIVLARLLLPEDYGNVTLLLVFITLFDVMINYGFGTTLIQRKNIDSLDYSTSFFCSVFVSLLVYLFIFFLSPVIATFYNNTALSNLLKIIGLKVVFSGISSIQNAYVAKNFLFKKSMYASFLATLLSGGVGIFLAYNQYGEWALVWQTLLSSIFLVFFTFVFIPKLPKLKFSFSRLKILFSFGWKMLMLGTFNSLYDEIRSLLIGVKFTTSDLAFYDKGRNFPKMLSNNVNSIIDGVIFSSMSVIQNETSKLKNLLSRSLTVGVYLLTPMLLGLALISDDLILLLYTEKWVSASLYLKVFCFSFLLMPMITLSINVLKSLGKGKLLLIIDLIKKTIGILILIITSYFGVIYIAYGVAITNFLSAVLHTIINKKILNYGFFEQVKDIILSLLPGVLMFFICSFLSFLKIGILEKLIIEVLIGILSFILLSKVLNNSSFLYLMSLLKRKK